MTTADNGCKVHDQNHKVRDITRYYSAIKDALNNLPPESQQDALNALEALKIMVLDGLHALHAAQHNAANLERLHAATTYLIAEPKHNVTKADGKKKNKMRPNRAQKLDEICRTHVLGYLLSWSMTAKQMIEFLTGATISEYIPRTPTDITARVITPRKLSNAQQLEFTATIDGIKTKHRYNLEYFTDKLPHHERQNQKYKD